MKSYEKIYEEYDATDAVGQSLLENNLKFMQNGIFKLEWVNVKSAVSYGLLWGLLSLLLQIQQAGTIFGLDWKSIADAVVLGAIAVSITLVKNLLTTDQGNFVGLFKVK